MNFKIHVKRHRLILLLALGTWSIFKRIGHRLCHVSSSVAEGTLQPQMLWQVNLNAQQSQKQKQNNANCDYVPLDTFAMRWCIIRQAQTCNPWIPEACASPSSNTHPPREVRQSSAVKISKISFWCFLLFPPYFETQLFYRDRADNIVDILWKTECCQHSNFTSLWYIHTTIKRQGETLL